MYIVYPTCGESWHATKIFNPLLPILKAGHPVPRSCAYVLHEFGMMSFVSFCCEFSKIFNPLFPVLKAGHSVSYSYICDVCREWVNGVGFFVFFLNFPVWLVCYAHVFHVLSHPQCIALYHWNSVTFSLSLFPLLRRGRGGGKNSKERYGKIGQIPEG